MRVGLGLIRAMVVVQALALALGAASWARGHRVDDSAAVHDLCSTLLTEARSVELVDVRGAPGLEILSEEIAGVQPDYETLLRYKTDAYHKHELVSSARYGKVISEKSHETVLMVPGIEHQNVPGFDGVILDAQGKAIANYSLKTIIGAIDDHSPLSRARVGIEKAEKFSVIERWLTLLKLLYEDQNGSFHPAHALTSPNEGAARRWLSKAFKLFGIVETEERKRPTRVVVDIQTDAPLPDSTGIETVRRWIHESKGLIESVTFMKGDEAVEVK